MKLLFWLAIVVAVIWLIRANQSKKARQTDVKTGPAQAEAMLQCRQCGIYLPASEAVHDADGEAYCCEAHRAQQPRT